MQSTPWTDEALLDHLQKAVYLELWTIPIYLTAAYSLQVPGTSAQNPPHQTLVRTTRNPNYSREQLAFNGIYSVAIQEMLHLELAANLFNSLFAAKGYFPKFTGEWIPQYDKFPAWIESNVSVQLGPANAEQLALMAAIETPEPKTDGEPNGPQARYDSIGQFYKSIEQGLEQRWSALYRSDVDHRQKSEFSDPAYKDTDYAGINSMITGDSATALKLAKAAIRAIVDQGEGSEGVFIDEDLWPADPNDVEDQYSHFSRFRSVQSMLKTGGPFKTYPTTTQGGGLAPAQQQLTSCYRNLLNALEQGYSGNDKLNLTDMWALPSKLVAVWAQGGVPQF